MISLFLAASLTAAEIDNCKVWSGAAYSIMRNRQAGAAQSEQLAIVGDSARLQALILEAYKVPQYSTEPAQKREIRKYRDDTFSKCTDATKKLKEG